MVAFRRLRLGKLLGLRLIIRAAAALFLSACGPSSALDFYREGEAAAASLSEEMSRIHSRDELQAALPRLRKKYLRIAKLALAARELVEKGEKPLPPSQASDELFAEIARLYELAGGRELLISAQAESLKLLE